jgi:hypothetical protein
MDYQLGDRGVGLRLSSERLERTVRRGENEVLASEASEARLNDDAAHKSPT